MLVELRIEPVGSRRVVVVALLDDSAAVHDHDPVGSGGD